MPTTPYTEKEEKEPPFFFFLYNFQRRSISGLKGPALY
jgi:hypothetical protein